MPTARTVEFIRVIEQARSPKRADRSAAGYLPSRAMRYCDALTTATGYGYWFFPPMDLSLLWDGERVFWTVEEADDWFDVTDTATGAVQFPNLAESFDTRVPPEFRGYSPPFLTALPELGGIQIWTGFFARTAPQWSLSVRAPANLPGIPGLVAWEGIVESDIWFGPLFNNFRITQTNVPVRLRASVPFLQVQPVPQIAYRDETLSDFAVTDLSSFGDEDWKSLGQVLLPNADHEARQGLYAVTVRKRRSCPFDAGKPVVDIS